MPASEEMPDIISHTPPADVAQALVPAVSRLVSTPVRGRDAVSKASVGMRADVAGRSACDTSLPPNIAEDHSAHLITQTFDIFWIGGAAEAFGEVEEFLLFALLSLHAVFDEFQQHPIGAQPARFGQAANLGSDVCRQAHTLPNHPVCDSHCTIMHQNGEFRKRQASIFRRSRLPARDAMLTAILEDNPCCPKKR